MNKIWKRLEEGHDFVPTEIPTESENCYKCKVCDMIAIKYDIGGARLEVWDEWHGRGQSSRPLVFTCEEILMDEALS